MKFIDEAIIEIEAGHGGKGAITFRREKYVPRGGPDGGNGGRGGHVVFKANHNLSTLMDFRYKKKIQAADGGEGMTALCDGRAAEDLVIPVPVGTVVYDATTQEVLADFVENGQEAVMVKGGRGGKGNAFFVTSTRQTPRFAQPGEEGEKKEIRLELKLLADVGLIGCPNAGKSTFLSVVSHAKPKIADYPFTTTQPYLGVVDYQGQDSFVIADLPGLIEGAHEGRGMGDKFLKHIERTRVLLHLISLSPEEVSPAYERYKMIRHEVMSYDQQKDSVVVLEPSRALCSKKKEIVLFSKADLMDKESLARQIKEFKQETGIEPIPVSSVTGANISRVVGELVRLIKTQN